MRKKKIICLAVCSMLSIAPTVFAEEAVIARNILGPEGPLFVDGNLYYVGWVSHTLSKWNGKTGHGVESHPGVRP